MWDLDLFFCDESFKFESLLCAPANDLENINKNDIYDLLSENSNLYKNTKSIRPRSSSGSRSIVSSSSNFSKESYVIINENKELLYVDFSKSKACTFLCDHAFKNEGFRLKSGDNPIQIKSKGIYNPSNFRKNYLNKKAPNKTVDNYSIEVYNVNIKDYVDYHKNSF